MAAAAAAVADVHSHCRRDAELTSLLSAASTNNMHINCVPALSLSLLVLVLATVGECSKEPHSVRTFVEHPSPVPHATVATQYKRQWHGAEHPVRVHRQSHTNQWQPSQWGNAAGNGVSYSAGVTSATPPAPAANEWRAATAAPAPAGAQWALLVPMPYAPDATPAAVTEHYHTHYAHDLGEGIDEVIAGSADEIRYARARPRGGYMYRPRPPARPRPRRRPRPRPAPSPVIIRIHKHRIIRD